MNLYDHFHCVRGDELVGIWPVDARGACYGIHSCPELPPMGARRGRDDLSFDEGKTHEWFAMRGRRVFIEP